MGLKLLNRVFCLRQVWALRYSFFRIVRRFFCLSVVINFLGVGLSRLLRLNHVIGMPYLIMLEPTSRCNLSCPMCARTFVGMNNRTEKDITLSEFKLLFNKVESYALMFAFWNFGEPFLNKDLLKMVAYAHERCVFCTVSTNGILLTKEKVNEIIASKLDYLTISMDGATEDSYKKYRKGGNFKSLLKNIRYLVDEKKRQKVLYPFIEIVFLIMRDNEHELIQMKHLAGELGVNKLTFKKVSLYRTNDFLDKKEFLPKNPKFIHAVHKENSKKNNDCALPWMQLIINSDGNISFCCADFLQTEKMGNLFTESVCEIWNGQRFRQLRKQITQNIETIPICHKYCPIRSFDNSVFIDKEGI